MKLRLPTMQCDDGCGACCGPVPVTEAEYERVGRYAKEHGIEPLHDTGLTCPWYQGGRCAVHPARPLACRVFGHTPRLQCCRGYNTDVPDRKIRRAVQRNGVPTRLLHEHAGPLEPVVQGLKSRLLQ